MNLFWGGISFLDKGGWVAWALALLSLFLWYSLGYRYFFLKSKYLKRSVEGCLKKQDIEEKDLLGSFILSVQQHALSTRRGLSLALEHEYLSFRENVLSHKQTIKSIVVIAPLMGLLGTVIGMIETFDSLQDAALFTQGGGIAGGISQALITTQMGLVVAIPGLLAGRKLDKKEEALTQFADQVVQAIKLQEGSHEV